MKRAAKRVSQELELIPVSRPGGPLSTRRLFTLHDGFEEALGTRPRPRSDSCRDFLQIAVAQPTPEACNSPRATLLLGEVSSPALSPLFASSNSPAADQFVTRLPCLQGNGNPKDLPLPMQANHIPGG